MTQSSTSLSGEHPSYCYSTQQCYDNGGYGYPVYNGYINDEPLQRLEHPSKPKITAALYKTQTIDEDDVQDDIDRRNNISLTEADVRSREYENKGFA